MDKYSEFEHFLGFLLPLSQNMPEHPSDKWVKPDLPLDGKERLEWKNGTVEG
tara:strand:- start:98 stop:253 length:156 start_codon:yes stop_codon:yes gene_type:complete